MHSKIKKIVRLFNTVKHLKVIQIQYRLYYVIRKKVQKLSEFSYPLSLSSTRRIIQLEPSIVVQKSYELNNFTFLNLPHQFKVKIDWNHSSHGKLWTYNLTYFDFLQQSHFSKTEGVTLVTSFIEQLSIVKDGMEPFPISLRGINWIKFLIRENIKIQEVDDSLFAQYQVLLDNLEYHLLGNHLLENGFSLLFGAYYFQDEKLYAKANVILSTELNEQVLKDGAHFELSPMYHQIMLFRLLDCINLVKNNAWKNNELLDLFCKKASLMLAWVNTVTFKGGEIPLLNDSANHITPTTQQLNNYADRLNVTYKTHCQLGDSGYRKISKERYECIVDIGNIGPDYIPGHAHSDTFNFELYIDGKPFMVDTAMSTYEVNEDRLAERSTASHNTVQIDHQEQSEVWGGFRVANRAKVISLKESKNTIIAIHDGYKKRLGALHQRAFIFNENTIKISDTILSNTKHNAIARLHFHPDVKNIAIIDNVVIIGEVRIKHNNPKQKFMIKNYFYSPMFNTKIPAQLIEISFSDELDIDILF